MALGAKMADFGGWDMPIEYAGGGVIAEHTAVRERVGIFDVSHLGKAVVKGSGARDWVNSLFTNDLNKIQPPKAQYTMVIDDATGGVVDDLIAYLKSDDEVFLIPNCANAAEVIRRMNEVKPDGIEVIDQHNDFGVIAVQGPKSGEVIEALGLTQPQEYMSFEMEEWNGEPMTVCRTGYTGEKGFELVIGWDKTEALWDALVEAMAPFDGRACGLGSRDTLRTEMGYSLHGHELNMEITPNMARAGWAVGWDKPAFWGKEVLSKQREEKNCRLSWGLWVDGRGIPRQGCIVEDLDGNEIGVVTSGTMSPTLKNGIALALLDRGRKVDEKVQIDVRGRKIPATVKKPPFVQSGVAS